MPDRITSLTLSVAFAACGKRMLLTETAADGKPGAVTVTEAGLLYYAVWYVLVYMAAIASQPSLKHYLTDRGSVADKCICVGLTVTEANTDHKDLYRRYLTVNVSRDSSQIFQAMTLFFKDLLDEDTLAYVVRLCVPVTIAQLPFAKERDTVPGTVTRALDARDAWMAKLQDLPDDSPAFPYVGRIEGRVHSSIDGTFGSRRASCSLRRPEQNFDPWYDTLIRASRNAGRVSLEVEDRELTESTPLSPGPRARVAATGPRSPERSTPHQTVPIVENKSLRLGPETKLDGRQPGPVSRHAGSDSQPATRVSGPDPISVESPAVVAGQTVDESTASMPLCDALTVCTSCRSESLDLTRIMVTANRVDEHYSKPVSYTPVLGKPCMVAFEDTRCFKSKICAASLEAWNTMSSDGGYDNLLPALWTVCVGHSLMHKDSPEPASVEALAVMIHLTAKALNLHFPACHGIQNLTGACENEEEFACIIAVCAGLFDLSMSLCTDGHTFIFTNTKYTYRALYELVLKDHKWCVKMCNDNCAFQLDVPTESRTNCHHGKEIAAYLRLNNLKLIEVRGDNSCGFHTISTLLDRGSCTTPESRGVILDTFVAYVEKNKHETEIQTYMQSLTQNSTKLEISQLKDDMSSRWLSLDEVNLVLKAHGKTPCGLTVYSFPIYSSQSSAFLCANHHFEPIVAM